MAEQQKYDVVIIGSGLGGLACGSILSQNGYRVCVLEKHYQIGGCLQNFVRKGCSFDTGMHYIGSFGKGEVLNKFFTYLGIADKIEAEPLDEHGFDILNIGGKEFRYAQGMENFRRVLLEQFPAEQKAVGDYIAKMNEVTDSVDLFNLRDTDGDHTKHLQNMSENVWDFIVSITDNEMLREVLSGLNSLYAGTKQTTSLHMHFLINKFFIQSAWRLKKGGEQIAMGLKDVIEDHGGTVQTRAHVEELVVENGLVSGAKLANGTIISGSYFVSNVHPALTVGMVAEGSLRKAYVQRIKSLENTISCFSLYIVCKEKKIKHRRSNYYYNKPDTVWHLDSYSPKDWPQGFMMYTMESREYPGYAESITVITPMSFAEVEQWADTSIEKRGGDYRAMKTERAEALITLMEDIVPDVRNCIDQYYSATPLTYRDYTGTVGGSMYGIMRDCRQPLESFMLPATKIKNLFLTGQNINLHGVLGVSIGALLTCSMFMDINELLRKIRNA